MPRPALTWQPFAIPAHLAPRHLGLSAADFQKKVEAGQLPKPTDDDTFIREDLEDAYRRLTRSDEEDMAAEREALKARASAR